MQYNSVGIVRKLVLTAIEDTEISYFNLESVIGFRPWPKRF